MNLTLQKYLIVLILTILLQQVYCIGTKPTFSDEYYQLLKSTQRSKIKLQKCPTIQQQKTKRDIFYDSKIYSKAAFSIDSSKSRIKLDDNTNQLSNFEYCRIFLQEICSFVSQIWTDVQEEFIVQNETIKQVQYQQNYASVDGGAMILRKSSNKIKSAQSILQDNSDKYMFTNQQLPIEIVIALKEEVSIQRIVIKSNQYYSSTINQFMVFGAFSLDNTQKEDQIWFKLMEVRAKNIAGEQHFRTVNKVIRFLKLRVISAHGQWKYFTMTQIKVHGNSLYAQAMDNYHDSSPNKVEVQPQVDTSSMDLYEDLKKMITLARQGNKTIPKNNLIKYFLQQLQKLSILQQKQILYMNNLTRKLQQLQSKMDQLSPNTISKGNPTRQQQGIDQSNKKWKVSRFYNHFKNYTFSQRIGQQEKQKVQDLLVDDQVKSIRSDLDNISKKLSNLLPHDQISHTTLIIICLGASFFVTTAAFLLAFMIMNKQSKVNQSTTTTSSNSPTSSYSSNTQSTNTSLAVDEQELIHVFNKIPQRQGKHGKKYRGKQSKRWQRQ